VRDRCFILPNLWLVETYQNICIAAEQWQIWDVRFGCVGTLSNLKTLNKKAPLEEIRSFLAANMTTDFLLIQGFEEVGR